MSCLQKKRKKGVFTKDFVKRKQKQWNHSYVQNEDFS